MGRLRTGLGRTGGAALLTMVLVATGGAGPVGAQGSFRGVAAAEGVRVGLVASGAPVSNQVVDGASPIAQAELDSTNGSSAFASVLYPGDVVVTTPGLLAGLSGGQTSDVVQPYPLIAIAGSTTVPESTVEAPGSSMRAEGNDRRAAATSVSGAGRPGEMATITTTARAQRENDDTVVAAASSDVTSATIGPLVLGRITARSVARRSPAGVLTRESTFEATGITVNGVGVKLNPDGLVVADTNVPVSASPLQPVLDQARVSLRYVARQDTEDGVVSAGLVVSKVQDLPGSITPVVVTYAVGRATAGVSGVALAADAVDGGFVPPAGPIGAPSASLLPAPGGFDAAPESVLDVGGALSAGGTSGRGTARSTGTPLDAGLPGTGAPEVAIAPGTARPAISAGDGAPVALFDATSLYLVLVAGAVAAGVVLMLLRRSGVRQRWI